ncbi:hypothetical protein ACU6TU_07355 [Halomonas sp. LS-001]
MEVIFYWISMLADFGTLTAMVISIFALCIARREMKNNRSQRQQEARFNYAKRAMKLYDLLMLNESDFLELDEQLPVRATGYTQKHLERILPIDFESIIHEAKVTHALSKSVTNTCPSVQIFEYMSALKSCKDKHLEQASRPPAARDPMFVGIMVGMNFADEKHYAIANLLEIKHPYQYLRQALFEQIEIAYQA